MKIGLVVAIIEEFLVLLDRLKCEVKLNEGPIAVYEYRLDGNTIYAVQSGAGEIYAAGAVQHLISAYNVDVILNFGIVGALTEETGLLLACVVDKAVHYGFDITALEGGVPGQYSDCSDPYIETDRRLLSIAVSLGLKPVICASADVFVAKSEKKAELARLYGAEICEMESAGILLTAKRWGVPCLLIKAVSDTIFGGAEEYDRMERRAAEVCFEALMRVIEELGGKN